jgi:ribosomal protein S13
MDIDPMSTIETTEQGRATDRASARLNMLVAISVAILATFMGICKVKDDNIVQAMQQAQANKIDHWAFYQARNIREEIANSTVVQLKLAMAGRQGKDRIAYAEAIRNYESLIAEQHRKKEELRQQAEQDQKDYDAANFRDDQFDLSDALIAIAIALLAVTALTHQRWLYLMALVPTAAGVVMGLSGLLGWSLHPTELIRLLS